MATFNKELDVTIDLTFAEIYKALTEDEKLSIAGMWFKEGDPVDNMGALSIKVAELKQTPLVFEDEHSGGVNLSH